MRRTIGLLLLAIAMSLALSSAQAQTSPTLQLVAGAPLGGGVSSGGNFTVAGTMAPSGAARAAGGQFSLVGGSAPVSSSGGPVYLPHVAR